MTATEDALGCPRCGAPLGESHITRAKVPFETEIGADGEPYTRYETLAVIGYRCTGCQRIVWNDGGPLRASERPYRGAIDYEHGSYDDRAFVEGEISLGTPAPAPVAAQPVTRAPSDDSPALVIAVGIVVFSVLCLLSAMLIGSC